MGSFGAGAMAALGKLGKATKAGADTLAKGSSDSKSSDGNGNGGGESTATKVGRKVGSGVRKYAGKLKNKSNGSNASPKSIPRKLMDI